MTDQTEFFMNQAINAIKAGDLTGGRKLLESVLEANPNNESAWMWMSAAVSSDDERRHCLEQVLRLNPDNEQARLGMEKLPPIPAQETEKDVFAETLADFAAFGEGEEQPAGGEESAGEAPAFTWPLEPEQRDLAPDNTSEEVDLEALFKSFDEAAEKDETGEQPLEWTFEEPLDKEGSAAADEQLTGEEALDRFLGVEPPGDEVRGFYEEDARQGKPVPAFTFDEETEEVLGEAAFTPTEGGVEAAFVSQALPDTEFSFDAEQITREGQVAQEERGTGISVQPKLWANPGGKPNSLIILREEYLVLANPDPLFVERIREEVSRGEVKKKSLGRTAKAIPLKSVLRVEGEPESSGFMVTYLKGKQRFMANAEFESSVERDEALEELSRQLGPGYKLVEENVQRANLILWPVVVMVLALLGTPLLAYLSTLLLGVPESMTEVSLSLFVPAAIGIAGFMVFVAGLIWLISKLRQPLRLVAIVPADEMEARLGGL